MFLHLRDEGDINAVTIPLLKKRESGASVTGVSSSTISRITEELNAHEDENR